MAAVDYFLKIDTVDGESRDFKHKDEIDILSWSWGETQTGSFAAAGGAGAGKVQIQDFHFTSHMSKASPVLMQKCANGTHFTMAVLTGRKAGEQQHEFMKYKLTDVMITSYQSSGSGGDVVPTDQFSLNFAKIEFEYVPQKEDGSADTPVRGSWDVRQGMP